MMKWCKQFVLTIIFVVSVNLHADNSVKTTNILPQVLFKDKKIGILSNIQGILGVHHLSYPYQVKSISSWKLNQYIEKFIFEKMSSLGLNVKIVTTTQNVMMLAEAYESKRKLLKEIMKNQNMDFLILVDSAMLNTVKVELHYLYSHFYDSFENEAYDKGKIDLSVQLFTLNDKEQLIRVSHSTNSMEKDVEEVYLKNKDGEKIVSNDDVIYVEKTLIKVLEPIYKKLVLERVNNGLQEIITVE